MKLNNMEIAGAIFDLDGTLIDSQHVWDYIWHDWGTIVLKNPQFKADPIFEVELHVIPFDVALSMMKEHYHVQIPYETLYAHFKNLIDDFYRTKVFLKPGSKEFLKYLYDNHIPLCIASGSSRNWVEDAIKLCGIEEYIPRIFTCMEIGKGKTAPDIYRHALEYLGTPKESTWVFEDAFTALQTAHHFGLKTVGVFDAAEPSQAELERTADLYIAPGETISKLIN